VFLCQTCADDLFNNTAIVLSGEEEQGIYRSVCVCLCVCVQDKSQAISSPHNDVLFALCSCQRFCEWFLLSACCHVVARVFWVVAKVLG